MSSWTSLSLKQRLIWTTGALVALSVLAVSTLNFFTVRNAAMQSLTQSTAALSEARVSGIAEWVKTRSDITQAMLPATAVDDPLPALTQAVVSGGFDTTYIGYANRTAIFSTPQNLPPDWDPTGRPWYRQAAAGNGVVLTEPYVDAGSGRLVMTFAVAAREGGAVRAVAASDVFMDVVANSVTAIAPTPSSYAFVVSSAGKVLVHKNLELVLKDVAEISRDLSGPRVQQIAQDGGLVPVSIDGVGRLISARPIVGTDWWLVIALHGGEAMAGVRQLLTSSLVAGLLVALASVLVCAAVVVRSLTRLGRLEKAMLDVASGEGDLTKRLNADGSDELARIAAAFNEFVAKIQGTLRVIRETSDSVNVAAREIASGNHDLSARTEQTASSLEETASTMEEMISAVTQSADTATEANRIAAAAAQSAARGGEVVSEVVRSMDDITHRSRRINDIIAVIDGIAFQTNILALNAAVEAARAGEQGRGFAVVASEVRTLAQRSGEAAKEIKGLIEGSVQAVENGSVLVNQTGEVMQAIVTDVQKVAHLMNQVALAANEQRQGISQIGDAVTNLDQMTQQNAALVEESAAAATALSEQADSLAATVAQFKI
ncbi:methyl-accepting chemotaxis sensory transducer with Cache sensor [Tepidicella xavieri]|uniref:Methyl-accepting chemotaxis sensory transducer with Cache sensor n=2 Tax=Tepidicella xavieri TaxID=360241 RepID=A0A4R6UD92_9BURK|nr:methyl-accepting chemotaxis sensory transducer with Cache sensor [Tepidicella xavieri]